MSKPNSNRNPNWRMPDMKASLYFNRRLAKRLLTKQVLVDYIYLTPEGKVDHQEQIHGAILAVSEVGGVEIQKHNTTHTVVLPPDLRPWARAKDSVYTLRSTGNEITGVDYLSSWIVR